MKEIGGYLDLERSHGNHEYYGDLIALNTARNALVYLLKARKIKKLYIPYFLCDSVSGVCNREGYKYEYYKVDEHLRPVFDKEISEGECFYLVNYYGQISDDEILEFKNKYGNLIVDNVQAFYQKPVLGIDTIYSCRKFFGVPDGAYLSTNIILGEELYQDISENRMAHIIGRAKESASAYYAAYTANEGLFENLKLKLMSELTHKLLSDIDYQKCKCKREENFKYLHERLGAKNKLNITIPEGPYMYPFYSENGMTLKKKLAAKKIYIPTLWPNVLDMDCKIEKDLAENILPLPCDQRYDEDDMNDIIKQILL